MNHAERVREAERLVVECADAMLDEGAHEEKPWSGVCRRDCSRCATGSALYRAAGELRALRAATCETCHGTGYGGPSSGTWEGGIQWFQEILCPAGCDDGRRK